MKRNVVEAIKIAVEDFIFENEEFTALHVYNNLPDFCITEETTFAEYRDLIDACIKFEIEKNDFLTDMKTFDIITRNNDENRFLYVPSDEWLLSNSDDAIEDYDYDDNEDIQTCIKSTDSQGRVSIPVEFVRQLLDNSENYEKRSLHYFCYGGEIVLTVNEEDIGDDTHYFKDGEISLSDNDTVQISLSNKFIENEIPLGMIKKDVEISYFPDDNRISIIRF